MNQQQQKRYDNCNGVAGKGCIGRGSKNADFDLCFKCKDSGGQSGQSPPTDPKQQLINALIDVLQPPEVAPTPEEKLRGLLGLTETNELPHRYTEIVPTAPEQATLPDGWSIGDVLERVKKLETFIAGSMGGITARIDAVMSKLSDIVTDISKIRANSKIYAQNQTDLIYTLNQMGGEVEETIPVAEDYDLPMESAVDPDWECTVKSCPRSFTSKRGLSMHLSQTHGQKPNNNKGANGRD